MLVDRTASELPPGVALMRALRWLEDMLAAHPEAHRALLVDVASRRFDLTPVEEEALLVVWAHAA